MKNRTELAKYFAELGFKRGAEIGVGKGFYSKVLLDNIPGLKLLCVDAWNRRGRIYPIALQTLSPYKNCAIFRSLSMDAVRLIPDGWLDFVFIDADHNYEFVRDDIREWAKKVRKDGIVSGHDYYVFRNSGMRGVIDAVDEYVKTQGYELKLTEWNKRDPLRDEWQPSWWFVKI